MGLSSVQGKSSDVSKSELSYDENYSKRNKSYYAKH